jgi:hypothetical protein
MRLGKVTTVSTQVLTPPRSTGRSAWYAAWTVTVLGVGSVVAAFWEAVGPFSVGSNGQSFGCGSPFLGRYIASGGDPGAMLPYMCLQDAPGRRFLAFLLSSVGLVLLLGIAAYAYRKELSPRGPLLLDLLGSVAAVLLLAGASFAVGRFS